MIDLKFRPVSEFLTGSPDELARQLSQLEDSHEAAITKVAEKALPVLSIAGRKNSTVLAKIEELTEVDTSAAIVVVQLPEPSPQNAGKGLVICLSSASNSATLSPLSGLINGASSLSISGIGRYELSSTGKAWFA